MQTSQVPDVRTPPVGEPLISTRGLVKRYGALTAVDGVDLTINRGEVYGFLGPNGAGKTTTLRMLVGLIRPTAGTVRVLGRPPGDPRALARLGTLIEAAAFYPYLSGRDNLRVLARLAASDRGRVDVVLDVVGLTDRAGDKFGTYSMGMKQRLGVAAALLDQPDLLILDEPTNGLDPAGVRDMRELIAGLGATGYTVLLSSHLLGEVQQTCDRVGVLAHGKLVAETSVGELVTKAEYQAAAAPLDEARAVAERLAGADHVRVVDGVLRVRAGAVDPGDLNRALHEAGATVTELRRIERNLEDVFFELTEDKS